MSSLTLIVILVQSSWNLNDATFKTEALL